MKGGRTAPRNRFCAVNTANWITSFNEGGADCPPKPLTILSQPLRLRQLQ